MRSAVEVDALPAQLLDFDERFVDMGVLGDHVCAEVKCETFGVQNVGRGFGQV